MHVPLLLAHALLGLRSLLVLGPEAELEQALVEIHGASFWVVGSPTHAPTPAREASDAAIRYRVLVERGIPLTSSEFVDHVETALADAGGWAAAGREFVHVEGRAEITVLLATPPTVDRLCKPLDTRGRYSCGRGGRAALNLDRWQTGTVAWTATLPEYRTYMVNHEVGHLLGMPHRECPGVDQVAPIMQQQTFGLDGCRPSTQPSADELARLRRRWATRG